MSKNPRSWTKNTFIFGGVAVWAVLLISCTMVDRTVVAPPHIAGATIVGSQACAECHEETTKDFTHATHARLMTGGENAKAGGCESCHGPGSKHVQSGGGGGTIVNPGSSAEACFQCHLDKRGEMSLPHAHPVMAGKMTCTECHDPHKGDAVMGGSTRLASANDTCLECHSAQRGPFVFEHEATREGCVSCHNPHGSVNAKMLKARNSSLCIQCHYQQQSSSGGIVIGGRDHSSFLSRGTCWTAGCHEAVHGSHVNSSLRF